MKYLDVPMSIYEFKEAIKNLVLHEAPGLNRVSLNSIKGLNHENKKILFEIRSVLFWIIRAKLMNGNLVTLKYYQRNEIYPTQTTGEESIC